MTPHAFIKKWQNSKLKERAAAQEHFLDLCRLLGEKTPAEVDPEGRDYAFEVGATKTTGGKGFADVFKRGFFGWEYKGSHAKLENAFSQLQRYAVALDNPPLLIVCDVGTTIRIHTNWTNSVSKVYEIPIADLGDAEKRGWLKAAFTDPDILRPAKTRQQLTEEVAGKFADLARSLRARYGEPEAVAHFINRLVFCMFAEDVGLLKGKLFLRMLERAKEDPTEFVEFAGMLFRAMSTGGHVGFEKVAWFNGGLFDDDRVFALTAEEIRLVHEAATCDWSDIDPSILGTLFERGLDPDKRSQLGAHYTDRDKIMMIIEPVIIAPLSAEWDTAKAEIAAQMARAAEQDAAAKAGGPGTSSAKRKATNAINEAQAVLDRYLKRLGDFRVLDPACGSGNFLYLALRALKDLEHRAQVEAEALGLPRTFPRIGPEVVRGIEINPYAAELARVSVWIGEIQWMLKNGFPAQENPVLKPLKTIECRDAVLNEDGTKAEWPEADVVVGNPPFIGNKKMIAELGEERVALLRTAWAADVHGGTDFVAFWFAKAWALICEGKLQTAGLVATQAIRRGANGEILKKITRDGCIFSAWSDEEWAVDGANVRVSLVCFDGQSHRTSALDGIPVGLINSDLTSGLGLNAAARLLENRVVAFQGPVKVGPFDIGASDARAMLLAPSNPNGKSNLDVIRPLLNGMDIVRRPSGKWIIDFDERTEIESALFEAPFEYVVRNVKPTRSTNRDAQRAASWWRLGRSGADLKHAIAKLSRQILTPRVSKHRLFVWAHARTLPDSRVVTIARDDDTSFGIIHSRSHELWSLRLGGWHGVGNDPQYTPSMGFETFPFPEGLTPNIPAADYADDPRAIAIATAAARLNELRENWLNPPDLVRREPEVVPGYPDRILPVSPEAEKELKKRTLTNLYNARPAWLENAHKALDAAVAAAYGWPTDLPDDEILARLFALNQERAAAQARVGKGARKKAKG